MLSGWDRCIAFLGLSVGLIQQGMGPSDKKNYTATLRHEQQVGFDHLRDNMATSMDVVQRPFNYCIIDEVDSILIDEQELADHLWAGGTTDGKVPPGSSRVATALKKKIITRWMKGS